MTANEQDRRMWQQTVEAVWTLTYISEGFRNALPRMSRLAPAIDDLAAAANGAGRHPSSAVLEAEIRSFTERFSVAAELLNDGLGKMMDILHDLEKRRAAAGD